MDVHSTSGEDDIASSVYRRKKKTRHLPQKTQNDTDSEDEKKLETSFKSRNRRFVFKESDNSESDDQAEHVATVSTEDARCSISQARTTKSPTTIAEDNQFEAPNPEPTVLKRKTRNLIKQEKVNSLQEDDESGFKMDSLLSKHSDLFDCESDNDDVASAPIGEEWRGKSKPGKQKKEREPKTARLSKKEQLKLHSEAQRIVRESSICLPKYQTKTKTLDDFLKKLKSTNTDSIKSSLAIKKMKENVQPEESLTSKTVLDSSNSDNVVSSVVICQEESSSVLSVGLQAENAAVVDTQNDEKASNAVLPIKNHSTSQKDALTHSQDSVLLELDNSQCSNAFSASKFKQAHIMKAVQDVPAPKLCSHAEWEETNIVSPVEELQKRLIKHASIISPEVMEDSALTRDEWKSILQKQVSERRASERKAIEEATRLDNEEFSPVESEAELTDEESLASGHEKEEVEKETAMDEEAGEVYKEDDGDMKEERKFDWHSDLDDNFSDDDDDNDDDEEEDEDSIEGDGEDSDDDELIVKSKKFTKQLDSDSDSELPSHSTQKPPTTLVVRNFPFDKEFTTNTIQTATAELSSTLVTKENTTSCEDGGKKAVDSGLGTSLMVGMSSDVDNSAVDNSILDSNSSKVDSVTLLEGVNPKRPSEDDTNMTIESGSLLSNATELEESSRSASICHYDEETQFLDANGFLNVKLKSKHPPPVLNLDDSTISSQLIQLCSGQFSPKNGDNIKLLSKKPIDLDQSLQRKDSKDLPTTQGVRELLGFKEVTESKPLSKSITSVLSESGGHCDGDTSQLLALCSGNFSSQFMPFSKAKQSQQTSDGVTDEGDSSSDDGDNLLMLTNCRRPAIYSNHTPVVNMNSFNEDSDDEMPRLNKRKSRKFLKNKEKTLKRRRLEEFVESEAELSGSDHGLPSDEERAYLDNVDDDEVLERWSGDSDVNISEDELKKQVNRVHMKYTLADDSANIKDIKERFLPGGDLYEDGLMLKDGYFRKRKFAHVGSETSLDLFADDRVLDSGDEQFNDENSQAEAMRRKQRLEKEEFLSQMRQHDSLLDDENSQQVLKLVKQSSVKISSSVHKQKQTTVQLYSARTLKHSCGSFLKRNKDELSKLSSLVTSTPTVNLSSSKNFVFQTGTTPTVTGQSERTAPQLKKSHSVKSKTGRSPRKSVYKRSRSLPQDEDSIFNKLQ